MDDGTGTIGVVGDASDHVVESVEAAGWSVCDEETAAVLSAAHEAIVAVGRAAIRTVGREQPDSPVVPVDAGRGLRSVPRSAIDDAIASVVDGSFSTERHPVLAVSVNDEAQGHAVTDVTLVTDAAAHISEFAVASDDERTAPFRADGVVVATPAGSTEYARRVGLPVLAPGSEVCAVAPIAPFTTDPDHWIFELETVSLSVERREVGVSLLADDHTVGPVGVDDLVRVERAGSFDVAVVTASRPRLR